MLTLISGNAAHFLRCARVIAVGLSYTHSAECLTSQATVSLLRILIQVIAVVSSVKMNYSQYMTSDIHFLYKNTQANHMNIQCTCT